MPSENIGKDWFSRRRPEHGRASVWGVSRGEHGVVRVVQRATFCWDKRERKREQQWRHARPQRRSCPPTFSLPRSTVPNVRVRCHFHQLVHPGSRKRFFKRPHKRPQFQVQLRLGLPRQLLRRRLEHLLQNLEARQILLKRRQRGLETLRKALSV